MSQETLRMNQSILLGTRFFTEGEFPPRVLEFLEPKLLSTLINLRDVFGLPIYPSPLRGAWVREGGSPTSRHFIGNKRLSDAGDFFVGSNYHKAWLDAQAIEDITGIGVYPYTKYSRLNGQNYCPALHIDIRPRSNGSRLFWMRLKDGTYINPMENNAERKRFFEELSKIDW